MNRLAFRTAALGVFLIVSAMVAGPFLSPDGFSVLRHSTSEQAGQMMEGAWLMRAGFVAFGSLTILAAGMDFFRRPFVRAALVVFGAGLVGAAIWSNASILPDAVSDMDEDRLHSIASGIVGTAFAAACAARLFAPGGSSRDMLAWTGLAISVLVPIAMILLPEVRGLLQRGMFGFSFLFVLREFWLDNAT